jgi:hypothetical protein
VKQGTNIKNRVKAGGTAVINRPARSNSREAIFCYTKAVFIINHKIINHKKQKRKNF